MIKRIPNERIIQSIPPLSNSHAASPKSQNPFPNVKYPIIIPETSKIAPIIISPHLFIIKLILSSLNIFWKN